MVSSRNWAGLAAFGLMLSLGSCSSDDATDNGPSGGAAGADASSGGSAGSAGSAGTGGAAGSSGTGGGAGSAGTGGSSGSSGASGSAGSSGAGGADAGSDGSADGGTDAATDAAPSQPFRVQRGEAVIPSGDTSVTLSPTSDYDAPTGPAFVRLVNTRLSGMGATTGGGTQAPDRWMTWVADQSLSTGITFSRYGTGSDCRVSWELVEYRGPASGPHALEVRGVGAALYASGEVLTRSPAQTSVVDPAKVVVLITGQGGDSTSSAEGHTGLSVSAYNANTHEGVFVRGNSATAGTVSYAVLELTGSAWSVQRVEHAYSAAGATETESITAVDTAHTFVHAQHQSQVEGLDELGAEVWLSSGSDVSFRLEAGATTPGTIQSVAWVISSSATGAGALLVDHYSGTRAAGVGNMEDTWADPITSVKEITSASVFGESARSTGSGTALPRGSIDLRLASPISIQFKRSDTGQNQAYRYSVVSWPLQ